MAKDNLDIKNKDKTISSDQETWIEAIEGLRKCERAKSTLDIQISHIIDGDDNNSKKTKNNLERLGI